MDIRNISYRIRDSITLFCVDVNPNYISLASVIFTIPILYVTSFLMKAIIVFLVLFLDSLDGYIARKYNRASRNGLVVDIACDRFSELVIFSFSPLLLFIVYVNILLSVMRLKKGWIILPLRHIYLLWLVLKAVGLL